MCACVLHSIGSLFCANKHDAGCCGAHPAFMACAAGRSVLCAREGKKKGSWSLISWVHGAGLDGYV